MKASALLCAAAVLLAGCMNFTSAERVYCLRNLDVCGFENGPHLEGAGRYVAHPSSAQVPRAVRAQALQDSPGAEILFVHGPEDQLIGWLANVPDDWQLELCGNNGLSDLACYGMTGASGAMFLPPDFEAPLRMGGLHVRVNGSSDSLRGYLAPHDGALLIAELSDHESAEIPLGFLSQTVVVARADGRIGITHYGGFSGRLDYGTGPAGARNNLGVLSHNPQEETSGPFPNLEELFEGALHVQDPTRQSYGQLVPPGALVLNAQADGSGMDPPTGVGRLAAVTVVVSPAGTDALWLVHREPNTTDLTSPEAPHGLERPGPEVLGGLRDIPSSFTADAFARRRVYVAARNSSGERGRAPLLAPGERLFGTALSDGVVTVGDFPAGAQVVFQPGSARYTFDLWTAAAITGNAVLRGTDGTVFEDVPGSTRFASSGEKPLLLQALEQQTVEVRVTGGASYGGTPRRIR